MLKPIDTIADVKLIAELKTFPNQPIIFDIINSSIKQLYILPSGKAVLAIEPACDDPFIFVAGIIDSDDVDIIIRQFNHLDYPMVYCNPKYHSLFLDKGWDFNLRVQLLYAKPYTHQFHNSRNWEIKPINNIELFKQCHWFEKMLAKNCSAEAFFNSKKNYVLCQDQEVISEAYLDYSPNSNYAEISVATQQKYRGQGAGIYITSYAIAKCLELKLIPLWSCQVNNRPSLKTAFKAGFQLDRYYIQMVPDVGNTLSPNLEKWIVNNAPLNWNS